MGDADDRNGGTDDRVKRELRLRWERALYEAQLAERMVELKRIESELLRLGLTPQDLGLSFPGESALRLPLLTGDATQRSVTLAGSSPQSWASGRESGPGADADGDPDSTTEAGAPSIAITAERSSAADRHSAADSPDPGVQVAVHEPHGTTSHRLRSRRAPERAGNSVADTPPFPAPPFPSAEPSAVPRLENAPSELAKLETTPSTSNPGPDEVVARERGAPNARTNPGLKSPHRPVSISEGAYYPPATKRRVDRAEGSDETKAQASSSPLLVASPLGFLDVPRREAPVGAAAALALVPGQTEPDEKGRRRLWGLRRSAPVMTSSIGFHVVALLILAGINLTLRKSEDEMLIISQASLVANEAEELQTLELEQVSELETTDVSLEPTPPEVPDAPPLGEAATLMGAAESQLDPAPARTKADEIGELASESRSLAAQARTDEGAEFFGVKAGGRKFVFVVDSSRSMRGGRFETAAGEVLAAVRRLKQDQMFFVLFYDETINLMTLAPGGPAESRPVEATPENIQSLERWVGSIILGAGAGPEKALEIAIEMLPDAIYLLSDGEFGSATERFLAKANVIDDPIDGPRPKVVVHTVGLHNQGGAAAMQRIASTYGGMYRYVPPPAKSK